MTAVLLVTASMLMFELLQTVVLSLQIFHQNAFLVVSLSLLGLGAGGSIATLLARREIRNPRTWLWFTALAFSLFQIVSMFLSSRMANNLLGIVLSMLPPFIFIGIFLSVLFMAWPSRASRSYFFDLVGSGLGCLALVQLLNWIGDAGQTVIWVAELGLIGAAFVALSLSRVHLLISLAFCVAVPLLIAVPGELFPWKPSKGKFYGKMLADPEIESELDRSHWGYLGRLDAVIPGGGSEKLLHGAFASEAIDQGVEVRFLFASGDNWSMTLDFQGNDAFRENLVKESPQTSAFLFHEEPEVLNIGLGGGIDVFLALQHGAKSVEGVEINPLMIEAVEGWYPEFFEAPYADPRVTIHELDGRTFVNNTDQKFDVITLTAVDTGAGLAAGANILSENYLYTQQAFDRYVELLTEDGTLFVYRPYSQLFRVLVTATRSLRKLGIDDPARHFALFGGPEWGALLLSRSPFTDDQVFAIESRIEAGDFGGLPVYLPGRDIPAPEILKPRFFGFDVSRYFELEAEGRADEYLYSRGIDFTPVTDDSPYFYESSLRLLDSNATRILLKVLAWVAVIGGALIFVPLLFLPAIRIQRGTFSILTYFTAIGLGFMLIEICLIQKLALFLGHPAYSITVTLLSILVFAGVGSLLTQFMDSNYRPSHSLIFVAIIGAALGYSFFLNPALQALGSESLTLRAVTVVLLLAPGSMVMGMPFPTMIRSLSGAERPIIPWAWAINAFSSVLASVLAILVAMWLGFASLLQLGAVCYLVALLVYSRRAGGAVPS